MIQTLVGFIKKISRSFFIISFIILFLALYRNYLSLYVGVLIYHIILGLRWAFSFLGWESSHISALILVWFTPEILEGIKKVFFKISR